MHTNLIFFELLTDPDNLNLIKCSCSSKKKFTVQHILLTVVLTDVVLIVSPDVFVESR